MSQNVRIESLAYAGDGVAKLEDGRAVFVCGAAPGDLARLELTENRKTFARARIAELLQPGPGRIAPRCPAFGSCGGCQWQHLAYETQLAAKQGFVRESLRRIGGFDDPPVLPILASPSPFAYRNKAVLPFQDGRIGFYEVKSHRLVELPAEGCAIQSDAANAVLRALRDRFARVPGLKRVVVRSSRAGRVLLALVTSAALEPESSYEGWLEKAPELAGVVNSAQPEERNAVFGGPLRRLAGMEQLEEQLGDFRFLLSASSFFQVHAAQTMRLWKLLEEIRAWKGTERVLELYCGVGTLSLALARLCRIVVGVENNAQAVCDARRNAGLNRVANARFETADAGQGLRFLAKPDVLLVDPPRKGLSPEVRRAVAKAPPPEILYVSCDPASLARDARDLAAAGYRLRSVQPLDMFPQTYHVECLAHFQKMASVHE